MYVSVIFKFKPNHRFVKLLVILKGVIRPRTTYFMGCCAKSDIQ